jgi:predicted dehydrogenase
MNDLRVMVLDPGHFHAALVQKEMYPELHPRVSVYAPLGGDVLDYMNRIAAFNARRENPTRWEVDLHASPDFIERMLRDRAGNIAVLAGRNRPKIDRIQACVEAGFHVLADKPWIISSTDLPKIADALDEAERSNTVAYDVMTERYEITSILQKELVNEPLVFGTHLTGSESDPGISARSIHHLMKTVAGLPIRRPAWFFDIDEYGEGLADVGTHVVDLVQWTAFPAVKLDYRADVEIRRASHWPTVLTREQFQQVTGETIKSESLEYLCNNAVHYKLRDVHVALEILWNWEAPSGMGDVYEATFRGTKASIELRQGEKERNRPELYVVPNSDSTRPEVFEQLTRKVETLAVSYPGLGMELSGNEARLTIPDVYRVGHEAHFAQVTRKFFEYVKDPRSLPAWEKSNMLTKYFISTKGVEMARQSVSHP